MAPHVPLDFSDAKVSTPFYLFIFVFLLFIFVYFVYCYKTGTEEAVQASEREQISWGEARLWWGAGGPSHDGPGVQGGLWLINRRCVTKWNLSKHGGITSPSLSPLSHPPSLPPTPPSLLAIESIITWRFRLSPSPSPTNPPRPPTFSPTSC